MPNTRTSWFISALLLAGCSDPVPLPGPSFDPVFPPVIGELMTISSPNVIDLNGDGVLDIVFGTGVERVKPAGGRMVFTAQPEISGYTVAVSGASNEVLWRASNPRDAFTTPRFAQLNGDSVPDVIMGGREGAFSAFSGRDGALLWRVKPESIAKTPFPYNFYTPAVIRDANGDGISDLIVVHGGDDTKMPGQARDSGFVAVVSGADGAVLKVYASPDHNELYATPIVYERPDGAEWLILGTGGETHGGGAFRVPVAALLDGTFTTRLERLVEPGPKKGVIAPPTLVELTGDAEPEIAINTFDGRLIVVDGATGKPLWQRADANEEAYHQPAVVRLAPDGRLGLFISRGIGVFPKYVGTVHRLLDARDGKVLYEYRDPFYPAGAPLAVDLNGDGFDEPFFFTTRFPSGEGATIHLFNRETGRLIRHITPLNYWTTPVIADARGKGKLELIGLSWTIAPSQDSVAWRHLQWQLNRMDLNTDAPTFRAWAGYMGTAANGRYLGNRGG